MYKTVYSVLIILVSLLFFAYSGNNRIIYEIRSFVSEDTYLAFVLALSVYSLKSFIPIIPTALLYLYTGSFFENPLIAFSVNICGLFCACVFPYLLGYTEERLIDKLLSGKYKFFIRIKKSLIDKPFSNSFILRLSPVMPIDIVSAVCGYLRIDFLKYIIGSLIGCLPGLFSVTLLGITVKDPLSFKFLFSVLLSVVTFCISYKIYKNTPIDDKNQNRPGTTL